MRLPLGPGSSDAATLVAAAAALALEAGAFVWALGGGRQALAVGLAAHAAACLIAAAACGGPRRWLQLLLALLLPPAGVAICALDACLAVFSRGKTEFPLYEELLRELRARSPAAAEQLMEELSGHWSEFAPARAPAELLVAPVASLMSDVDIAPELKLAAIRNLTHLSPTDSVPLVKEALRSDVPAIRFYAARLLSNLEDGFSRRLRKLEEAGGSPDELQELARARLEFAESGLLESADARRHRERAAETLRQLAASGGPGAAQARAALARAELELGRAPDALASSEQSLAADPSDAAARRLALEAALAARDYAAFRRHARELARHLPASELARDLEERCPSSR
ncbi:MAG: hypothetical protein HYY25_05295 [Candidatus Wallbacteria bacterium]|nr:hypothetical protein [Candidatus Wallbacteria bacterium]